MYVQTRPMNSHVPRQPYHKEKTKKETVWQKMVRHRGSYLYVAPMFILYLVFSVYPLFASIGFTLYQWNGIGDPSAFVGLDNFKRVIGDSIFWGSFLHSGIYTVILVPIQLTLALLLALVLNNPKLRGSTFYRTIYFLPVVTSPAVIGVIVQLVLANFGPNVNDLLIKAHLFSTPVDWLGDPTIAMGTIIIVGIWQSFGYNLVFFLAGLQTIPAELYEAARIDGANTLVRLFSITLPMLRAVGIMIVFLAIYGSMQVFDIVQTITRGGPYFGTEVVNTYIYHQAFGDAGGQSVQPNVGFASAASLFYGLILLVFSLGQAYVFVQMRRQRAALRL
ncbi:carbohydrate ABC transporter permease [Dictyobacter alpinus]|nr:sugar ABC transporter permease [Dictyobacter alpinus]